MNKKEILAIVVGYNVEPENMKQNIQTYIQYVDKVLIVDNSTKNMNLSTLEDDNIKYITLNGNFGIAKALNVGIKYAKENQYKYVLTMDQDSKFNNNLIDEYSKNENEKIIIYSPNYIIERKLIKKKKQDIEYVYWTMTSGNLLNIQLYEQVGPFLEKLFIDAVDYEFCLRARKKGYKILQCNKAILLHNPGITKIKKIGKFEYKYGYMSPLRLYYQIRNLSVLYHYE